jgi:cyclic-di-AMP phosphodiesterase PgpH
MPGGAAKSRIKFFNPEQKNERSLKRLRDKLLAVLKNRHFWWGIVFLIALLLLFSARLELSIPNYKLGDIAQSTIRSPQDFQVPDVATTEKKRKEAQERSLPVYDFQPGLVNSSVSRMQQVFESIRTYSASNEGKKNFQKLSENIQNDVNIFVDPAFLAVAAKKDFSPDLETYLTAILKKAMSQYIISDRNVLFLYGSKGVTVRNPESGREETLSINAIQDVRNVHEIIKTELEGDRSLSPAESGLYTQFLKSFVVPTISLNITETQARIQSAAQNIEAVFYQVKKGKVIVRDGEEVTPAVLVQLKALRDARHSGTPIRYSVGIFILVMIFLIAVKKYLDVHQFSDIKLRNKALFEICGLVMVFNMILIKLGFLVASSVSSVFSAAPFNLLLSYQIAVPFATGALLLSILTDRQIATFYSLALAIFVGVLTRGDFYLAFYCLATSTAAAFSINRYYQRSAILRSCLWVGLANVLSVFTIFLLREIAMGWNEMAFNIIMAFLGAGLSAAVSSVLSPLLEWLFNITTDIKLLELSNLDLPVLRQLALEAPGTYHHSIVMGTIAEAAAEKVHGNPLFLRVAALYHDIGKVRKSEYYVENQRELNKHDSLNPRMSALIIMNHVKEGLEVAKMLRLPSDIADMIPQHHGTRLITYFYKKAKDMENPEIEQVKEEDYRYPGPKPQTKEGAILMLADATEAASRTLTEPSPARIRNMINTLFRAIFEDGQLDESNLTMKDLTLIADAFVRKLESVFHHRIAYPGYEFNKDEKTKTTGDGQDVPEKMAH